MCCWHQPLFQASLALTRSLHLILFFIIYSWGGTRSNVHVCVLLLVQYNRDWGKIMMTAL